MTSTSIPGLGKRKKGAGVPGKRKLRAVRAAANTRETDRRAAQRAARKGPSRRTVE